MRGNKLHKKLDSWVGQAGILALAALPGPRAPEVGPAWSPRRILVVKLAALGDTLLMVPALRELRGRYPGARIAMLGTGVNRAIAGELPFIDEFHCLEPGRAVRDPGYLRGFVRELKAGGYELGIDFDQWTRSTPVLLRLAGVPVRIGFVTSSRMRHLLYTHTQPRDPRTHEAENFLRLLRPLGIEPPAPVLELPVRTELVPRVRGLLAEAGWNGADPILLVHPGCGHAHPRAWPAGRYRELCVRLAAEASTFFVFTGAGDETPMAEALAAALPAGRAVALTRLSIPEFVACVSLADLVLSGNTGAMHVAAALGRAQVFLEGPNDPAKWGPINPRAVGVFSTCPGCPCLDFGFEFHRTDGFCMEQIPVERVRETVARELAGVAPPGGEPYLTTSPQAAPARDEQRTR